MNIFVRFILGLIEAEMFTRTLQLFEDLILVIIKLLF